eukprot:364452-Chlamydomonas_euryale.AAC.3
MRNVDFHLGGNLRRCMQNVVGACKGHIEARAWGCMPASAPGRMHSVHGDACGGRMVAHAEGAWRRMQRTHGGACRGRMAARAEDAWWRMQTSACLRLHGGACSQPGAWTNGHAGGGGPMHADGAMGHKQLHAFDGGCMRHSEHCVQHSLPGLGSA